jgi:hypothetical protein
MRDKQFQSFNEVRAMTPKPSKRRAMREEFEAWMCRYPHDRGKRLFMIEPDGLHAVFDRDSRTYTYNDGSEHLVNSYWQGWQAATRAHKAAVRKGARRDK